MLCKLVLRLRVYVRSTKAWPHLPEEDITELSRIEINFTLLQL